MKIILSIFICITLFSLVCAVWMFVWSVFEETELGMAIIDKIKHRKGGADMRGGGDK